jgi:hypothetical protein
MKKYFPLFLFLVLLISLSAPVHQAKAEPIAIAEIIKQAVIKVIKAVDLQIQCWQF